MCGKIQHLHMYDFEARRTGPTLCFFRANVGFSLKEASFSNLSHCFFVVVVVVVFLWEGVLMIMSNSSVPMSTQPKHLDVKYTPDHF